jgi:hypothetical protein
MPVLPLPLGLLNLPLTAVATAPSPPTSGATLTITTGEGATRLPAVPFYATIGPANTPLTLANAEIVLVTAKSGDQVTAMTRAQGGTTARTVVIGDQFFASITKEMLEAIIASAQPAPQVTTATGAQHNFDLNGPHIDLYCTGAAPSFSGFTVMGAAPYAGCRVRIWCKGTSAKVTDQDTNSTAANRNDTPSAAGQIVGLNGVITLAYDDVDDRWKVEDVFTGNGINVPFNSANFTASSGNWTLTDPDQIAYRYWQNGTRVEVEMNFNNTTISATPSGLRVEFTGVTGFTVVGRAFFPALIGDAGTASWGHVDFNSAQTWVQCSKVSGTFATQTNDGGFSATARITVA